MGSVDRTFPETVMASLADTIGDAVGWNRDSLPKKAFERAVADRMAARGVATPAEYLLLVRSDREELRTLSESVTVQESWFFRQRGAFEYLVHFLADWNESRVLRILSVGCAHGEEPFSVVMTLLDAGLAASRFQVDAVDLSTQAIETAKKGIYTKGAFRERDVAFRHRYFVKIDDRFHLSDTVRDQVAFRQGNATEAGGLRNGGPYDIIFCRNMLIYLHPEAQKMAITAVRELLTEDGVLIVGPAEGGLVLQKGFRPVRYPGACAFRRFDIGTTRKLKRLALIHEPPPSRIATRAEVNLLVEASRLADKGEIEAAEKLCRDYLRTDATSAEAHFILGLIEHSKNDEDAAFRFFERAVYLDGNHYEALVYLSLLCGQRGDEERAQLFRERAGRVLRQGNEGG